MCMKLYMCQSLTDHRPCLDLWRITRIWSFLICGSVEYECICMCVFVVHSMWFGLRVYSMWFIRDVGQGTHRCIRREEKGQLSNTG